MKPASFQVDVAPSESIGGGVLHWTSAGLPMLTMIAKRTYAFEPSGTLRVVPSSPLRGHDETTSAGIRPRETWPLSANASFVVLGRACAPMGRATAWMEVGLTVTLGDRALIDKRVIVRAAKASNGEPASFTVLPLTQAEAGELVPSFSSGESAPFGARAASHRDRASLLRFDQARLLNDRALELAPDFPPAFFDAAAPGMTCARLSGSERLTLHHLHPARAQLAISLDVPRVSAEVRSAKGVTKIQLVTDLIVVDADRRIIEVVSRGGMAVDPTHPAATVHFVEALPSAVAKTMLGNETVPPPTSKTKKKRRAPGPTGTAPIDPADVAEVRRMAALQDTAPGVDAGTKPRTALGPHGTVPLSPEQVAAVRRAGDLDDSLGQKPKRTK